MTTTQVDFIKDIFAITADYDGDGNGLLGESDKEVINLLKTEYPALFKAYELLKGKTTETEEEAFQQALEKWAECMSKAVIKSAEKEEDRKDITCDICPYFYENKDENAPRCHYEWDDRCAPCEVDDFEEKEEDD